jgi:hypothetical protein
VKKDFHMDQNSQLEQRIRDCAVEDRRLQREIEIRERAGARDHSSAQVDEDDEFEMERGSHSKNKESRRADKHRRDMPIY